MADPNEPVLQFTCPKCSRQIKAGGQLAGRRVKCPKCQQPVRVPGIAPQAKQEDDWLSLDAPAISDVAERNAQSQRIKQTKEQARKASPAYRAARSDNQTIRRTSQTPDRPSRVSVAKVPKAGPENKSPVTRTDSSNTKGDAKPKPSVFDDELPPLKHLTDNKAAAGHDTDAGSAFDDLPELAELEPTSRPSSNEAKLLAQHLGESLDQLDPPPYGATEEEPPVPVDPEYRIACTTCGTAQYVPLSSKGMKIKCPDCYSQFKVPSPPPGWSPTKKKPAIQQSTEPDIGLAPEVEKRREHTEQGRRDRASKILERAEKDVSEEDIDNLYEHDFDTAGFIQRTFGCFRDPVALAQILIFGIVFGLLFAMAQFGLNSQGNAMGYALLIALALGLPVIGIIFALPMLSSGLALIESVANREPRVTDWPGFNLFDNIGDVLAIAFAFAGAILPGFFLGSIVESLLGEGESTIYIRLTGMMITLFALFPVFLLSMLDNGSLFQPLSSSILQSFSAAPEAWGGYFLKTMCAFFATTVIWYMTLGGNLLLAGIAGFIVPVLVFFTCQQIGALADSISDHLSFEFTSEPSEGAEEGGRQAIDVS